MTTRTDVIQDYTASPRVSEVAAPSTEFLAQDVVDTLRVLEGNFRGSSEKSLLNASGKQNLGGGVQVGITVEMQDNLIAFEGRTTPAQTGTVTTASSLPVNNLIQLIDSSALFITNLIARGSLVVNFDDNSVAEVVRIVSETELLTKVLKNGTSNTFTFADSYHVFNIIQCNVLGGNTVAVDENNGEISPILPTAFTQVVRTSSSSATLVGFTELELLIKEMHGQIPRSIHIDTQKVINGVGYQQNPYNNFTDAVDFAEASNMSRLIVHSDATVDRQLKNFTIDGIGLPTLDLNGQVMTNTIVRLCGITGSFSGVMQAIECAVFDLSGMQGVFYTVSAAGILTVGVGGSLLIWEVAPAVAGQPWTLNMNSGVASTASIQNSTGGIIITNMDHVDDILHINSLQGSITINASCVAGEITITGDVEVIDNSVGTLVKDNTSTARTWRTEEAKDIRFRAVGKNILNPVTGKYELYDLDNVLYKSGNAFEDAAGTTAYQASSTQQERVDKLA